jgi:hypothetical protein
MTRLPFHLKLNPLRLAFLTVARAWSSPQSWNNSFVDSNLATLVAVYIFLLDSLGYESIFLLLTVLQSYRQWINHLTSTIWHANEMRTPSGERLTLKHKVLSRLKCSHKFYSIFLWIKRSGIASAELQSLHLITCSPLGSLDRSPLFS